jgi:hypothetical protein
MDDRHGKPWKNTTHISKDTLEQRMASGLNNDTFNVRVFGATVSGPIVHPW